MSVFQCPQCRTVTLAGRAIHKKFATCTACGCDMQILHGDLVGLEAVVWKAFQIATTGDLRLKPETMEVPT